jgi:hypothetical protein
LAVGSGIGVALSSSFLQDARVNIPMPITAIIVKMVLKLDFVFMAFLFNKLFE